MKPKTTLQAALLGTALALGVVPAQAATRDIGVEAPVRKPNSFSIPKDAEKQGTADAVNIGDGIVFGPSHVFPDKMKPEPVRGGKARGGR